MNASCFPNLTLMPMVLLCCWHLASASPAPTRLSTVVVSKDGSGFVLKASGESFLPWGFNYDHDGSGRLLEDYWETEWNKVEEDFREMKDLGANVVRIHLQVGKFVLGEKEMNRSALGKLERLVELSERVGLYLDVTGLGCYHAKDVPEWYDALTEERRWAVQAMFWQAVARQCKRSPAIFCYDLMNEPVAPSGRGKGKEWLGPPFAGKHFVQWISQETKGRERSLIARQWIRTLVSAIRKEDKEHMVTVGLVSWSLDQPGLYSGFSPQAIAPDLDFISVHLYPEKGKVDEALETLGAFKAGKPVVIEETFPLKCSREEFELFLQRSSTVAKGWIGFYWGKTPAECEASGEIGDAITLQWLKIFQRGRPR